MKYYVENLKEEYEVEIERVVLEIKKQKAKRVLLQFPDGLKPFALSIADAVREETKTEIRIWLGSCFGACDIPKSDCDLLIQFGHAEWKFNNHLSFS